MGLSPLAVLLQDTDFERVEHAISLLWDAAESHEDFGDEGLTEAKRNQNKKAIAYFSKNSSVQLSKHKKNRRKEAHARFLELVTEPGEQKALVKCYQNIPSKDFSSAAKKVALSEKWVSKVMSTNDAIDRRNYLERLVMLASLGYLCTPRTVYFALIRSDWWALYWFLKQMKQLERTISDQRSFDFLISKAEDDECTEHNIKQLRDFTLRTLNIKVPNGFRSDLRNIKDTILDKKPTVSEYFETSESLTVKVVAPNSDLKNR